MRRTVPALALVVTASVGLSACSGSSTAHADGGSTTSADTTSLAATAPPSTAASVTPRPTPSSSSSQDAPTESPDPSAAPSSAAPEQNSAPQRAAQAQVPAGKLPGFTARWKWDRTERLPGLASPCLRSGLVSIGAVKEVGRILHDSSAPASSTAAQVTAVFPDEHTALTAAAVLTAWHDDCAESAAAQGLRRVSVSPLSAVPTPVGTGEQWLVTAQRTPRRGSPAQLLVWQGFVRDADTITLLAYTTVGPEETSPAVGSPIERGLAVAGDYLLRSR
jgi:hypothetical protein